MQEKNKIVPIVIVIALLGLLLYLIIGVFNNGNKIVKTKSKKLTDSDFQIEGISLHISKDEVIKKLGEEYTEKNLNTDEESEQNKSEMIYKSLGLIIGLKYEETNDKAQVEYIKMETNKANAMRDLKILSKKEDILKEFETENILEDKTENSKEIITVGFPENGLHQGKDEIKIELLNDNITEISLVY